MVECVQHLKPVIALLDGLDQHVNKVQVQLY